MAELTVLYDKDLDGHGEAGICISNMVNGKTCIMKMELGEQANILYRLLTEQMKKAEIKKESKESANKTLDKIRAEINSMSGDVETIANVLAIFNKYKEGNEMNVREWLNAILDKAADDINKLKKVSDGNKVYVSINEVFDIIDKYRKE